MPTPKTTQRKAGPEKNRKAARLSGKASSFHGRGDELMSSEMLPRPRTVPDLLAGRRSSGSSGVDAVALGTPPPKLTKLLLNVTVQRSLGAVRVVMPLDATVEDLIAAALRQYAKEARAPVLPSSDASGFDLHYSQFSLESLDREAKVTALGSRNFFLYPRRSFEAATTAESSSSGASCSKEAHRVATKGITWLKFMDFLR